MHHAPPPQYYDSDEGAYVTSNRRIARHYGFGWFPIDFVSILPFDMFGMIFESKDVSQLKMMRLIRLLRLVKLARVLRASRVLARLEQKITIRYSTQSLIKFTIVSLMMGHWLACFFYLSSQFGGMEPTQCQQYLDDNGELPSDSWAIGMFGCPPYNGKPGASGRLHLLA